MEESCENTNLLSGKIQYEKCNWYICGDLWVVAVLFGYTEFCCFLSEWEFVDRKHYYIQKQRHEREPLIPDRKM
jgi:hypothetical protein